MPVRALLLVLAVALGLSLGIGLYAFVYAKGFSYMSDDPGACANCHAMNDHYSGWIKSSHHTAAVCNDCHTPANLPGKLLTKALNGFWHSFYFTTGNYPDEILITGRNRGVSEGACLKCHADMAEAINAGVHHATDAPCLNCHRAVGHPHGF